MKYLSIGDLRMERPVRPIDAPLYLTGTLPRARRKAAIALFHQMLPGCHRIDVTYAGRWDRTALALVDAISRRDALDTHLVVLSFPTQAEGVEALVMEGPFARFMYLVVDAPRLPRPPSVRTAETLAATVARATLAGVRELQERWLDGPSGEAWLSTLVEDLDDPASILEAGNDAIDVCFQGLVADQREYAVRARRLLVELRRVDEVSRTWLLGSRDTAAPDPLRHRFLVRDGQVQRWARWVERPEMDRIARSAFATRESDEVQAALQRVVDLLDAGELDQARAELDALSASHPIEQMSALDRVEYRTLALRHWRERGEPERAEGHVAPLIAELEPTYQGDRIRPAWELGNYFESRNDDAAAVTWYEQCLGAEEAEGLLAQSESTLESLVDGYGRLGDWAKARERAERRLERVNGEERARALGQLVRVCARLGDGVTAQALAGELLSMAETDPDLREGAIQAVVLALTVDHGSAASRLDLGIRGLAIADRYGIPAALRSGLQLGIGVMRLALGQFAEAAAAFNEGAHLAGHVPGVVGQKAYIGYFEAIARAAQTNDRAGTLRVIRAGMKDAELTPYQRGVFGLLRASTALSEQHPEAAKKHLAQVDVGADPALLPAVTALRARIDSQLAQRRTKRG